jgi:nucleoid DNA-binding protein
MALKNLTDVLAREYGLPAIRTYELVNRYHALIAETLERDGKVALPHIGVLSLKHRPPREITNPATGILTRIPERVRVGFRAATDLVRRLNPKVD